MDHEIGCWLTAPRHCVIPQSPKVQNTIPNVLAIKCYSYLKIDFSNAFNVLAWLPYECHWGMRHALQLVSPFWFAGLNTVKGWLICNGSCAHVVGGNCHSFLEATESPQWLLLRLFNETVKASISPAMWRAECNQSVGWCSSISLAVNDKGATWALILTSIGNPLVETRRSKDRLISTMGFHILVRRHLSIESGPSLWSDWELL